MHLTHRPSRRAFTLVELLVAIAIIVILIGILIPTVRHVTGAAKEAATKAFIAELSAAFDAYHTVFNAYPGPLSNNQIRTAGSNDINKLTTAMLGPAVNSPVIDVQKVTQNENSVLGLLGGLEHNRRPTPKLLYNKDLIGKGPRSLVDPLQGSPKQYEPFMTNASVSGGRFSDEAGTADDTEIPEFVDRFTNRLPLIIVRAWPGRTMDTSLARSPTNNEIITDGTQNRTGHYDISQFAGYTASLMTGGGVDTGNPPGNTSRSIGVGKSLPEIFPTGTSQTGQSWRDKPAFHGLREVNIGNVGATLKLTEASAATPYYYPYDSYAYFTNQSLPVPTQANPGIIPTPRQKDRYIIISAGKDRVYGTEDDITNFGSAGAP